MHIKYIKRDAFQRVEHFLEISPALALLGPRQCGKSNLIRKMSKDWDDAVYLDLQNPDDVAKLSQPGIFFENNADRIVCLDEIQWMP